MPCSKTALIAYVAVPAWTGEALPDLVDSWQITVAGTRALQAYEAERRAADVPPSLPAEAEG